MDRRILTKQHQGIYILEDKAPDKAHCKSSKEVREEKYGTEKSFAFADFSYHQCHAKAYDIFDHNSYNCKFNGVDKRSDKLL